MASVLPRVVAHAARARSGGSGPPLRSALAGRGAFSSEAATTPAPAVAAAATGEEYGDDLRSRIFRLGLTKRSATAALERWSGEGRAAPTKELHRVARDLSRVRRFSLCFLVMKRLRRRRSTKRRCRDRPGARGPSWRPVAGSTSVPSSASAPCAAADAAAAGGASAVSDTKGFFSTSFASAAADGAEVAGAGWGARVGAPCTSCRGAGAEACDAEEGGARMVTGAVGKKATSVDRAE
jgi:hypothetical protein